MHAKTLPKTNLKPYTDRTPKPQGSGRMTLKPRRRKPSGSAGDKLPSVGGSLGDH